MGKKIDLQKADRKERRKRENALWRTLLDCLSAITELQPWDQVDDSAPFAYIPESGDRMIFFSCVQDAEDSVGIMVFPSPSDYRGSFQEKATAREDARHFIEMDTYNVFLTNQEEVPPEMWKIYRRLSLDFQAGLWPWVIHKRWGRLGSVPQGEDLAFLLDCLGNFYMQLRALREGKLKPDFEGGDMLLRFYAPKDKLWRNVIAPFALPPDSPCSVLIREDAPELRELKSLSVSNTVRRMEFDFGWLDEPVQARASEEPYFPIEVVLTDRQTGDLLSLYHCRPENLIDCAFTAWSEVLHKHGIPETLYLCRDKSYDLFEDFAQKLGIKIKRVKHLPAAEKILRNLGAV